MNYIKLGKNLRAARPGASFSQVEIADLMGMARTTIVAVEQGKRKLNDEEIEKFSNLVGVPVVDLVANCKDDTLVQVKTNTYKGFLSMQEYHLIRLIRHRKWLAAIEMIVGFSQESE